MILSKLNRVAISKKSISRCYSKPRVITRLQHFPNEDRHGIVASTMIQKGNTIFVEDPIVSAQIVLNKKFVNSCQSCMKHVSMNAHNVLDFLPKTALPHLPGKLHSQFIFQIHKDRKFFCDPNCFEASFNNHLNALSPESKNISRDYDLFLEAENEWSEYLPTVPAELILKAVCLEVRLVNPKLEYKNHKLNIRKKLKILSPFKPSTVSLDEFDPMFEEFSNMVNVILKPVLPFQVSKDTIKDSVNRVLEHGVHLHLNSPRPIEPYLATAASTKQDAEIINKVEEKFITSGSGNIKTIWHPTMVGLYENLSTLKRSSKGNAEISFEQCYTNQLELIATRNIQSGEEITLVGDPGKRIGQ